jgi:hypothetical protein
MSSYLLQFGYVAVDVLNVLMLLGICTVGIQAALPNFGVRSLSTLRWTQHVFLKRWQHCLRSHYAKSLDQIQDQN